MPKDTAQPTAVAATIGQADLCRASATLARVVSRRPEAPLLGCIRVEVAAGLMRLSATDIDIHATIDLEAETEGVADFVIPAHRLAAFARAAEGPVGLAHDGETVALTDGTLTTRIRTHMSAADMPTMGGHLIRDWQAASFRINPTQGALARLLRLTLPCVNDQITGCYLNGVHLCLRQDTMTLRAVSTNGYMLACIDSDLAVPESHARWGGQILPVKAARLLLSLLERGGNEPVSLTIGPLLSVAQVGNARVISRMIDERFPEYDRVIPEPSDKIAAYLGAHLLRRLARLTRGHISLLRKSIRLEPGAGSMTIRARDEDITAPLTGHGTSIDFNATSLATLSGLAGDCTLTAASKSDPARITGDDPDALWVIMPMSA